MAGRLVTLTVTEFEVLRVLSTNAGRAVTYESLLRQAWGQAAARLHRPEAGARAREGSPAASWATTRPNPVYVRNERGVGYRMPRPGER